MALRHTDNLGGRTHDEAPVQVATFVVVLRWDLGHACIEDYGTLFVGRCPRITAG